MIGRVWRALTGALDAVKRNEAPAIAGLRATHPALADWCAEVTKLADALLVASVHAGLDPTAIFVRADGRDQSMAVVVRGVRFHAAEEYPYMVRGGDKFAALALQASNLNDRYLVSRLREVTPAVLHPAIDALAAKLDALPKSIPSP